MQRLGNGQAAIFLAYPGETTAEEAKQLYQQVLSPDERERTDRFADAGHRHDHIVARSLVRFGLTSCFSISPQEWCFARDEKDRPHVIETKNLPTFQFSLSHTRDLAGLLVTLAPAAGLDLEWMQRQNDLGAVAQRICSPAELHVLNRLSADQWRTRFFQLWTLKEAYAKARGLGLGFGLENISFEIDRRENVVTKDARGWQFVLRKITSDHVLAAALDLEGSNEGYEIELRTVRVNPSSNLWAP